MGAEYLVACRIFFVFVRFLERLTLDPLAPAQSKRSFSILDLLLKMCTLGTPFRNILESFGRHLTPLKDMEKQSPEKTEKSANRGFKTCPQKVIFLVVFGVCARVVPSALFLVPQGGPKGRPKTPTMSQKVQKSVPKTPSSTPQDQILSKVVQQNGARNCISVMSYWVWSQTESTCPQVLPRCSQMLPDVPGRFHK